MYRKAAMTLVALVLGGAFVLVSTPASAQQQEQQKQQQPQQGKARGGGGGTHAIAPRGGNRAAAPHTRRDAGQRAVKQRRERTAAPHTVTQRKMRTAGPRKVIERKATERKARTIRERNVRRGTKTPKIATPRRNETPVTTSGETRRPPLRGISRMHAGGRNFSVWRGKHRVRHNNGWRTFVSVGALSSIMFGDNNYYPYAYISADEPYCSGLTDEGCQLHWREAETVEGEEIYQCVAYCPWR